MTTTYANLQADPEAIERDIERTRDRMSDNLEELTDRLNPAHIKRRAKDAIEEGAEDVVTVILEAIVRNPLPAVAVTLGALSVLVRRHERRRSLARIERVRHRGSD